MRVRSRRWTALCPPARFAVVAQSRGGHASPCLPHRPRRARRGVRRGLDGYTVLEQFVRTYAGSKTKADRPRDPVQRRRRPRPAARLTCRFAVTEKRREPGHAAPLIHLPPRGRSTIVTRVRRAPGPAAF